MAVEDGSGGYIGAGGGIAPGNGFAEQQIPSLFKDKAIGFNETDQKFVFPDALSYTIGRFLKDFQAMKQSLSLQAFMSSMQFSPGTMIGLSSSGKIPGLISSK